MIINFFIPFWGLFAFFYVFRKRRQKQIDVKSGPYIAILSGDNLLTNASAASLLIRKIEKNVINYKIFDEVEVDTFIKVINDYECEGVFFFGHGSIHGLKIKDGPYYFCNFHGKKIPKKYVVQLNCNHGFGKSLAEIISTEKDARSYCAGGKRNNFLNIMWLLENPKNF